MTTKWTVSQARNGKFCVQKKRGKAKTVTLAGLAAPSLNEVLSELTQYMKPGDIVETPEGLSVYSKLKEALPS